MRSPMSGSARPTWEIAPVFDLRHVDALYHDFQCLWDVTIEVGKGEIIALIGSNGAGKTSVLRVMAGFLKPERGEITLEGATLNRMSGYRRVELGISMVPEGRRLFPDMTVLENLELGAYAPRARRVRAETFDMVFELFPVLKTRMKQIAKTLSGGEQQMLAIGRALMAKPRLLLVDELSLGLAPVAVQSIYRAIRRINETMGLSIVIVEQNVRLALDIANRGYIIENGRLVGHGKSSETPEQ